MSQFSRRKVANLPDAFVCKWSRTVLDEGFVPFPKRLMRCLGDLFTDMLDLQVVLAIVDFARPNPTRHPSYDFLAYNAGVSPDVFKARVLAMQDKGWLRAIGPDDNVAIVLDGLFAEIVKRSDAHDAGTSDDDRSPGSAGSSLDGDLIF